MGGETPVKELGKVASDSLAAGSGEKGKPINS